MIGLLHCLASFPRPASGDWLAFAPLGAATSLDALVKPSLVLVLCVVAGVGTLMLLPSRNESPVRKIGGILLLAALLILTLGSKLAEWEGIHVYFWIFSFIAIGGAIRVITHPRPVYSALYFVLTVFATAGLFILLWAEFMAAALVLIYAGAILITYVFVIMLASPAGGQSRPLKAMTDYDAVSREPLVASAVGFALMGMLLFVIFDKATALTKVAEAAPQDIPRGNTQALGWSLFNNHLINLELAGLILTVSTVGAIVIARRRVVSRDDAFEPTTETYAAPATPIDDNPHSIPVYGTEDPRQKEYPET
jgi:NADH-quinone oxidoreductase subunit J